MTLSSIHEQIDSSRCDQILDCRGLSCPEPVMNTSRALQDMAVGQILAVVTTDRDTLLDIPGWARLTRQQIVDVQESPDTFVFYIRRLR